MRAKQRKQKNASTHKRTPKELARDSLIQSSLLCGGLLVIVLLSRFEKETTFLLTLLRILLSAIPLYYGLLHPGANALNAPGKATLILSALIPWAPLLPGRIAVLTDTVIFLAQCVLMTMSITTGTGHIGPGLCVNITLIVLMMQGASKTFVNNPNGFHYLPISLLIAAASGFLFRKLLQKGILRLKDDRTSERVATVILAAALGFAGTWVCLINLNYALDTSKPTAISAAVSSKHISSGKSTTYYLTVWNDGEEVEMKVHEDSYDLVSIGDPVTLQRFEGAFNDPYYMLEIPGK